MASAVDISNLAMSHLGQDAIIAAIDPPDGSIEAQHCATFYPIARDEMLERHAWGFARRRAQLANVELPATVTEWQFGYQVPADCITPLAVLIPGDTDAANTQDFTWESDEDGNGVLYTNVEDAVLRYTARVEDTTKFTPLFVIACARLLAHYAAGPITKDKSIVAGHRQHFETVDFPMAAAADSRSEQNQLYGKRHTPSHLAARASGSSS